MARALHIHTDLIAATGARVSVRVNALPMFAVNATNEMSLVVRCLR